MSCCDEALLALNELEQFVAAQKDNAEERLHAIMERRAPGIAAAVREAETKKSLDRDERFLRLAREYLSACEEEKLESLIEEMRGLSHYFCVYCSDNNRLIHLRNNLSLETYQALHRLRYPQQP